MQKTLLSSSFKFGRVEPEHVARKFEFRRWRENHTEGKMQSVSFEGAGAGDWDP